MNDVNVFLENMITKEMVPDLNMLHLGVLDWIVRNLDGTLIVTE
jgi:hypothetical protein